MKNLKTYMMALVVLFTLTINAQDNSTMQNAIDQGKADLIEVLSKTGDQFNFGVTADEVKGSRMASAIPYHEMDIQKLLSYNQQGIAGTLKPEHKKIVPLVDSNKVVTTLGVSDKDQGRYKVTELINHQYHNELNQLPNEAKQNDFKNLKIVYVPNLNTTVYTTNGKSYTNYNGRSLRESVDTEVLMQLLKADAAQFQQKYGNQLKDGKLLN